MDNTRVYGAGVRERPKRIYGGVMESKGEMEVISERLNNNVIAEYPELDWNFIKKYKNKYSFGYFYPSSLDNPLPVEDGQKDSRRTKSTTDKFEDCYNKTKHMLDEKYPKYVFPTAFVTNLELLGFECENAETTDFVIDFVNNNEYVVKFKYDNIQFDRKCDKQAIFTLMFDIYFNQNN